MSVRKTLLSVANQASGQDCGIASSQLFHCNIHHFVELGNGELQEVTFGILLYAGTVSGRKGLKTLTFMAGVDGFVTVTESRVFKAARAFFLIGKGAMVVYHLM